MTRRTIRTAATTSSLALATALALGAVPAAAQVATGSFQGTPTTAFGTVNVTEGPGTTDIQVDTASAVLDWAPDDTAVSNGVPIFFQSAGTTATFHNNPTSQNDFAILNRIVPVDASRPIVFDGTVISRLQVASAQVPGGTVFFYSPGGIIVGNNAVFDVGNLGLTTAAPVVDGNGFWYTGNQVQFAQAASGSFVDINPGAQITASSQGSYVAAFAPYIAQSGTIDVNGQIALVAGEAGTITFSPDGLFDIQVTIGSDGNAGVGIETSGTTGGPSSSGTGDNHRVYMVAIPKNTLLSMIFERGASVGFDVAGAADTVGNAVVLSAGHNITGGAIDAAAAGGSGGATIAINDSSTGFSGTGIDFTSTVTGDATGDVSIDVFRQTNFASDTTFHAGNLMLVGVGAIPSDSTGSLTVGGNLTLSSDRFAPVAGATGDAGTSLLFVSDGANASIAGNLMLSSIAVLDNDADGVATGGTAQVSLDTGGSLDVGGDLVVNASSFTDGNPGVVDALGGNAQVNLFGASTLDVAGVTRVLSYGIAGTNNGFGGFGADGTGGFSGVFVSEASSAFFNELNIAADGVGGADVGAGAGDGTGGAARIDVQDGDSSLTVTLANATGNPSLGELDMLSSEGFGGATNGLGSTVGGTGTGGSAGIFGSAGATINLPTDPLGPLVRVIARGTGGAALVDGTTGGDGVGGSLSIFLDNATMTVERLLPSVFGNGGSADPAAIGTIDGGNGFGGTRDITLSNGSTFTGSVVGGVAGGGGGDGNSAGRGGDGSGGSATLTVDGSTLNATGLFLVSAQSGGGEGASGGNAIAGDSFAQIINGGVVNLATGATLSVSANAFTDINSGGFQNGGGAQGGAATGGLAALNVFGGSIVGDGVVEVIAVGQAGGTLQGGDGTGGNALLTVDSGTIDVADVAVIADGTGRDLVFAPGTGSGVVSGSAFGGNAQVVVRNATIAANTIDISAEGDAGDIDASGYTNLTGGAGTGGFANLIADVGTSTVTANTIRLDASASGGTLFGGTGTGGDAAGGSAQLQSFSGATITLNGAVTVIAEGDGSSAQQGGNGGTGTGGDAGLFASGGAISVNGDLTTDASATGGDGTAAGAAFSGVAFFTVENGSIMVSGSTAITSDALGGLGLFGGSGGAATAGTALLDAHDNSGSGMINLADVLISASATGGDDGSGGSGGAATGGSVQVFANTNGTIDIGNALLFANADGGLATGTGAGGNATGGFVTVDANGGAIAFGTGANADARASGGLAEDGDGGSAQGGNILFRAINGGSLMQTSASGSLSADVDSDGGSTSGLGDGGDAFNGTVTFAANGGTVSVGGNLGATNAATGGNGINGGNAISLVNAQDEIVLFGQNGGTFTVAGTTALAVQNTGGNGAAGGAGGDALAGPVIVDAGSAATGAGSTLHFADLVMASTATGGNGGTGTTDGAGGAGGSATAFGSQLFGTAGAGDLIVTGSTQIFSFAQGGTGGAGGSGATGGVGGAGGDAESGYIQFGTRSGMDTPNNDGSATFADVSAQSVATGGAGGSGGNGSSAQANGGTGGNALAGGGVLLVRGSPVVADSVSILGNGFGGNGGAGGTQGAGGYGAGGSVSLTSSQRFNRTERGSATVNSISLQSIGQGGSGSTPGVSYYGNAGGLDVMQSDVVLGAFSYSNSGALAPTYDVPVVDPDTMIETTQPNVPQPDFLTLSDAQVTANTISMATPGELILNLDNSTLDVGGLIIQAGSLVLPASAPATPGTINVSNNLNIFVNSGASILTYAGFNTDFGVGFTVDGDFQTGDFTAAGGIFVESLGGSVTTGNLVATDDIELVAAQAVNAGNATTGEGIDLDAGTTVTAGNLTAGDTVEARAQGNVVLGNLSAGIVNPSTNSEAELSVGIISLSGNVSAGDVMASNRIAMLAGGGAALGNLAATDVLLLMGGNLTTGGIAADRVHIADDSDVAIGGGVDNDNFDFEAVFAAPLTPTGGSILIGGPVAANSFRAASLGGFTAGVIGSNLLQVESNALVTVNGAWTGSQIDVLSGDIAIAATGLLDAGTGSLRLISTNFGGMFVGDGLSGTGGYRLSNAEFGRIRGGEILIAGVNVQEGSAGVSMTIGNLAIDGSQLGGPNGFIDFATGDPSTFEASGRIRVDGEITATNMGPDNFIEFFADSIEVNAESGGISVSGIDDDLGGTVLFEANNIHVASNEILLRLRDDPLYAGRADDLNRAGAINRPEGVLRALGLQFFPGQTLYIQNTGSATVPAGFFAEFDNSDIEPPGFENPGAPDVDVIINGQFQDDAGNVTGRDAYDLVVANAESLDGFTETSQLNGCLFSGGSCSTVAPEMTPPPTNSSEITALTEDTVEEEPFDTEEDEDDAEQAASAPIAPPVVLINTRPISPDVDVTDPVSGTGNPALIGASISDSPQGDQP